MLPFPPSSIHSFIAGLLEMNTIFIFLCLLPVYWKSTPSCFSLLFISRLTGNVFRPALGLVISVVYATTPKPSTNYLLLQLRQQQIINNLPPLFPTSFLRPQALFPSHPSLLSSLDLLLCLLIYVYQTSLEFLKICQCRSSGPLNHFRVDLLQQVRITGKEVWQG